MKINYPIKKAVTSSKSSASNRGMTLEEDLNESNLFYLVNDVAVIHKKPTPVQVVKVDYPARYKAKITEAYYKTPSTTDYNGIYKGRYIDFEAKETTSLTSFPLKNLSEHQVSHLRAVSKHGGIGFIIVAFSKRNEIYVLPFPVLEHFWMNQFSPEGRKSIPIETFITQGILVTQGYHPRIDYLKAIDSWI